MSRDQPQSWITEEACFTVSPGARQVRQCNEIKMSELTPAERREFLKSVDTEWQTLLKNQAARVLSPEETARALERWPDRSMDTRWARIWKPHDSMPSGRRAKARLTMKGFTDPDLIVIESHSSTLTGRASSQSCNPYTARCTGCDLEMCRYWNRVFWC